MRQSYKLLFFTSGLVIFLERFLGAFWHSVAIIVFFLAATLLGLATAGGPAWHFIFMACFALILTASIVHGRKDFALPRRDAVWRRIERDNRLPHNPFATLSDKPTATPDIVSYRLWQAHIGAAQTALSGKNLLLVCFFPDLARRDPYALRFCAVLCLIVAFIIAGGDARPRLVAAFSPPGVHGKNLSITLDAWVTPPAYTSRAPVFLTGKKALPANHILAVPAGSILSLRINGQRLDPEITSGKTPLELNTLTESSWSLDYALKSEDRKICAAVTFWQKTCWQFQVAADAPPAIHLAENPQEGKNGVLKLSYTASDDYGITKVRTVVRRRNQETVLELTAPLPLKNQDQTTITTATHDLTSHEWSGLPVQVRMTATDAAGQTGQTEEKDFVLPERVFLHPVARRVASERRSLIQSPGRDTFMAAATSLLDLAETPQSYDGDIVTFLALNAAGSRLLLDKAGRETGSVIDLLWRTAIRIEDGNLSLARADLKKVLDEISEKLNDPNVSEDELKKLMNELEKALTEYANALNAEMKKTFADGPPKMPMTPEMMQQLARRIDMERVMEHLKNLSATNSREAMQQMLGQMSKMVENLDPKALKEYYDAQNRKMQELQKLQDVITEQQKLLDKTNRAAGPPDDGNEPGANPSPSGRQDPVNGDKAGDAPGGELAGKQRGIRKDLSGMAQELDKSGTPVPDAFGKASESMKQSAGELDQNSPAQSVPHQKAALDALQGEMDQRLDQMAKEMEEMMMSMGLSPGPMMGGSGQGYDPFGRPGGPMGNPLQSDVKIPDAGELKRVRQIIEELRRRSNDPDRPRQEKNYLDRLLKQF